jgi:hypothetical protein
MPLTRSVLYAALVLALAAPGALAQDTAKDAPKKLQGKLICGSFSAQPKASPPWNDPIAVEIAHGAITVVRTDYPPPKGVAFTGVLAPSGAILIAGDGDIEDGKAAWNYEFSGKLNDKGTTDLKGKLTALKGALGTRTCSMSF